MDDGDIIDDYDIPPEFNDEEYDDDIDSYYDYDELPTYDPGYIEQSRFDFGDEAVIPDKKVYESPHDISIKRARAILGDPIYSVFSKNIRKTADNIIVSVPEDKMVLQNIEILVPAAIIMAMGNSKPTHSTVEDFLKKTQGLKRINHLDLIRYVRMLSS